jgi:hypothetical protein
VAGSEAPGDIGGTSVLLSKQARYRIAGAALILFSTFPTIVLGLRALLFGAKTAYEWAFFLGPALLLAVSWIITGLLLCRKHPAGIVLGLFLSLPTVISIYIGFDVLTNLPRMEYHVDFLIKVVLSFLCLSGLICCVISWIHAGLHAWK